MSLHRYAPLSCHQHMRVCDIATGCVPVSVPVKSTMHAQIFDIVHKKNFVLPDNSTKRVYVNTFLEFFLHFFGTFFFWNFFLLFFGTLFLEKQLITGTHVQHYSYYNCSAALV